MQSDNNLNIPLPNIIQSIPPYELNHAKYHLQEHCCMPPQTVFIHNLRISLKIYVICATTSQENCFHNNINLALYFTIGIHYPV